MERCMPNIRDNTVRIGRIGRHNIKQYTHRFSVWIFRISIYNCSKAVTVWAQRHTTFNLFLSLFLHIIQPRIKRTKN